VPLPGLFADLAADDPRDSPSQRLLQQVAASAVLRRAGVQPGPSRSPFVGPQDDPRPITPAGADATWRRIVSHWPVLEDEWLLAILARGLRLAPELVGPLLVRHRSDVVRSARVRLAAGPLADWLLEHQPRLGPASRGRMPASASAESVGSLPELSMVPELAAVLETSPAEAVRIAAGGVDSGAFGVSHRAVLVNFLARVRSDALPALADALDRVDPSRPAIGLAFALADLARLRHHMLTELEPT
jgi:hypothetical protein